MIKKVFIGIIAAGMILTTIPTVNAEDEITLDEVTDQIIDISDKYNSAGVTSGQLLNLITLTQTDDELLDAISLDKNDLFDTSIPKKLIYNHHEVEIHMMEIHLHLKRNKKKE